MPVGAKKVSDPVHARLSDDREWFVQAPVEIRLRDGEVVDASRELPAVNADRRGSGRMFADQIGWGETSAETLADGGDFESHGF
jgi:hypothetical protein